MGVKVCKFGGTSLATASSIEKCANIIKADDTRRYVVVSAPGKRDKDDKKITDLLYKCYGEVKEEGNCEETFKLIRERFVRICEDLKLKINIKAILDETEKQIVTVATPDFAASRGEYLSARVFAEYMGYPFMDAEEMIRFDSQGNLNADYTNDRVKMALKDVERAVIPGFYGKSFDGKIKTFSRGGSDITGSIIARGVSAEVYENWTDVSGFLICDPRIEPSAKTIKQLSYQELRELSYMGANVLHSEAIFPAKAGLIPINIRNTFAPEDKGTMILPTDKLMDSDTIITGIAGKKNFSVIYIEKALMNSEIGFARKVLSVIEHHGICFEHMPSGIDTLSVIIASEELKNGVLDNVVSEIREYVRPDYVRVLDGISIIATVGHGMAKKAGTAAKLFNALAKEKINIQLIDQGSSELNIIIGVANSDYENTIRAIYRAFYN